MIERISNDVVTLRPMQSPAPQDSDVTVKIDNKQPDPADYLYNPDLADRINTSRQSIREELQLLERTNRKVESDDGQSDQQSDMSSIPSHLETLRQSLKRMESLLYQVASVAAADPDLLQNIQQELVDEMRGFRRVFKEIDFEQNVLPNIDLNAIDISDVIEALRNEEQTISYALEVVEKAESAINQAIEQTGGEKSREVSRTEATLNTAEQNLAAAESAFYPEEILDRAKEVATSLRERMAEAFGAQGNLKPDDVFKLVGAG